MYLNQFSVRIPEGSERTSGYVEIGHGQQYTIVLRNDRFEACDAEVSIDGKDIGTFRIYGNSNIRLERKPDDNGRFTFYRKGSPEGDKIGLDAISQEDLGLVRVRFIPEKNLNIYPYIYNGKIEAFWGYSTATSSEEQGSTVTYCSANSAGGTGLSGHSNQGFTSARSINRDYSQETTIYLRLVASKDPRPLTPVMNVSPVPPPVA